MSPRRWIQIAACGCVLVTTACTDKGRPPPRGGDAAAGDGAAEAAPPSNGDVTFFAFGDPQYGGGPADKNSFHIQALNQAPDLLWPAVGGLTSAGSRVGEPRGVIIAGDLTQNGQAGRNPLNEWFSGAPYTVDLNQQYGLSLPDPLVSAELGLFLRDYGLGGNDGLNLFKLKWRVLEGYGNHDFDVLERFAELYKGQAPAVDVVSHRNQVRRTWPEMRRFAPGNAGHYSWDWDHLHVVHLNLAPADMPAASGVQYPRDPRGALTFLQQDLAAEVGTSCRPVMVVSHYGFDPFSQEERWWDAAQRMALLDVLRPYNVAALLHGHVHMTRIYQTMDRSGKIYDVFSLGSPFYAGYENNGGRGHFAIFRLKGRRLEASDVSWQPANPGSNLGNGSDLWTDRRLAALDFQPTTTYPDGFGGWSFARDLDPTSCAGPAPGPQAKRAPR
jgi:hypothetical protein